MLPKIIHIIACTYGAGAVILGAFGAHFLKSRLDSYQIENWKTAVFYQIVHSLLLVILAIHPAKFAGSTFQFAVWFLIIGVAFFSGSIYLLSLKDLLNLPMISKIGFLTPIGGLLLIISWVLLGFSFKNA